MNSLAAKFYCGIRRQADTFKRTCSPRSLSSWLLISSFFMLAGCGGGGGTAAVETVALPADGRMTSDASGNIFISDSPNLRIIKMDRSGVATIFAGQTGMRGVTDGSGSAAQFTDPSFMATDVQGNVYVSDRYYFKTTVDPVPRAAIRKITPNGMVTTFAGSPNVGNASDEGSVDGVGTDARFVLPVGLTFDPAGNLFVADGGTCIRKITPSGVVTTFVGTAGVHAVVDGVGAAAQFFGLALIVSDATGNLYGIDSAGLPAVINIVLRKITPEGVVTTIASHLPIFNSNQSLAINPTTGTMYYSDGNGVYKITSGGIVSPTAISTTTRSEMTFLPPNILAILSDGVLRKVQVDD